MSKILKIQKVVKPSVCFKVEDLQKDYNNLCVFLGVSEIILGIEHGNLIGKTKMIKKISNGDVIILKPDGGYMIPTFDITEQYNILEDISEKPILEIVEELGYPKEEVKQTKIFDVVKESETSETDEQSEEQPAPATTPTKKAKK